MASADLDHRHTRDETSADASRHHAHGHGTTNERRTFVAMLVTLGFMGLEVVGGIASGSLALLADAAHMLTDGVGLALAWLAFRLADRPADLERTYGFGRLQVVVAFANGITIILLAIWILVEAASRMTGEHEVLGGIMLAIAAAGLCANCAVFVILHGADRENLNIRGAMLHVVGDLLGSAAAIVAAIIILLTGWTPIDPLLSVLVACLMLRAAYTLVRGAGHILLEGTPGHLDLRDIKPDLLDHVPGIVDVHHVHAWSITQERTMITLHVRVAEATRWEPVVVAVKQRLQYRFGIGHATVEIERGLCADREDTIRA